MSEMEEGTETLQSQESKDPFSPSQIQKAASQLQLLQKTSLTIYNLSTPISPIPIENKVHQPLQVFTDDTKERRYDLAYAIAKHAYESRMSLETKTSIYHLAFLEYYKLIRIDDYYKGALESVLFLLAILGFDEHCLGLMDHVLRSVEEDSAGKIPVVGSLQENEHDWLQWVFGHLSFDNVESLLPHIENFGSQIWSKNAFLVPLLLIALRNAGNAKDATNETIQQCVSITKYIETNSMDETLTVLQVLLSNSNVEWGQDDAISVLSHDSNESPDDHRWEDSCLLFWNILQDCIEQSKKLGQALQETIVYMKASLHHPSISQNATPKTTMSLLDLLDASNPQAGKLYCLHCRQSLSSPHNKASRSRGPPAMRCSRCCAVHYCSRTCQKKNYSLHKERCKNISTLQSALGEETPQNKSTRYDLAYALVDLAYVSTDTMDRGRKIYHLALVEYCRLLQQDFFYAGALESTMILLAVLGYDTILLGIIDFVFYRLENDPNETFDISKHSNGCNMLLEWTQGLQSSERLNLWKNLDRIALLKGSQWSKCNFLLPLLFWSLKQQSRQRTEERWKNCMHTSAAIARAVEDSCSSNLPVLRGLLPDSIQRWGQDEAKEILSTPSNSNPQSKHWEESCLLFWEILKDSIAFTPKVADALEETIETMEKLFGISAKQEVPHDLSDYATWSGEMSKEIR